MVEYYVDVDRISFKLAIVLQCPSWPNKANIKVNIVVSFHYSTFTKISQQNN